MKLNLGCGKRNFGNDWIHIDGSNYSHIHSHNIVNLPFNENNIDIIYCSHTFEYFDREEAIDVLLKWKYVLKEGGILIITTPNNHSIRSMLNYLFRSHFTDFLDESYPAHIMPMIKKDLDRITDEVGFSNTKFYLSNHGKIPKLIKYSFQQASFGYLKGKYFSDNFGLVTEKLSIKS